MTAIHLERFADGRLYSCKVEGHSGYAPKGSDIVCSAVSFLMRTALQVLSDIEGVQLESDTALRGMIYFSVKQNKFDEKVNAKLVCAGDFLEKGFCSLEKDYPKNILYKKTEV